MSLILSARSLFSRQETLSCILAQSLSGPNARKRRPAAALSSKPVQKSSKSLNDGLIIGIDPGLTGAIAICRYEKSNKNLNFMAVFDVPTKKNKGGKNRTDLDALSLLIESYAQEIELVLIEEVGQIGTKADPFSSFVFGFTTGATHGVVAAHIGAKKIKTVKPNVWKAALGLDANKDKAIIKAKRLFPAAEKFLKRKKDHGRAEALLLAYFAHQIQGGRK